MKNNSVIQEKINEIEEMKRIGLWWGEPLPEAAYAFHEGFAADTMSVSEWLQFIFIPRVREAIKNDGPWPEVSEVGIYAAQRYLFSREAVSGEYTTEGSLDGKEAKLVSLLGEFDDLFK